MTKYTRQDPEISRRKFINVAMGTTAGVGTLSLLSIVGGVKPANVLTPEKELPRKGDVLVYADPAKNGAPVALADIQVGQVVYAFPKGRSLNGSDVVKNGVPRNQLIVAKFPADQLKAPTDVKATDQGIVVYSRQCMHLGCAVEIKPYPSKNLQEAAVCPCHGGVYDLAEGAKVVDGPPPAPLPQLPIKVQGSQVVVDGFFLSLPKDLTESEFEAQKKELEKA
ncbi:Rieske 2Fe-2S domain-containing protein [Deinococcus ruber]|uniref:(2Fe-2S)-binding protein n=1 Tax=Deinococcus ruber TaxID=1848197 RepID=A0A918CJR8_9DEIO|nr:Rieske 2Fe-2S domain-containing protein [Deinococcus ruber]GGR27823.1 (2Fe-2S)-binding protein [Deinococcus ruber]